RHVVVQTERARVVHDNRAPLRRDRRPLLGHLVGDVEHGHVDPVEDLRGNSLNLDLLAADREPLARRPGRRHQADLPPHVLTRGKNVQHDSAHRTGGPHNGESGKTVTHRPVPPYTTASTWSASNWNSRCAAATAASTSSCATTIEMRISEVEIISVLMPSRATASKNRAVTPG